MSKDLRKIKYSFIHSLEGMKEKGYVPIDRDGPVASGVTIGGGFDLGQTNLKSLKSLGLPARIESRLEPYLGFRGKAARDLLKRHPLILTKEDALLLTDMLYSRIADELEKEYDMTSDLMFAALPSEIQTVIFSVKVQYGNLKKRTPKFWNQVVTADWQGALDNLRNFGDDYPERRKKEAALLQMALV